MIVVMRVTPPAPPPPHHHRRLRSTRRPSRRCAASSRRDRRARRGRPRGRGRAPRRSGRRLPPQRPQPAVPAARQLHLPARRRRHAARDLARGGPASATATASSGRRSCGPSEAAGHALWAGIDDAATSPARDVVPARAGRRLQAAPVINIVRHGGRYLALAEVDPPFEVTADSRPSDRVRLRRRHPAACAPTRSIDPLTGEMVLFRYDIEAPFLIGRSSRRTAP